MAINIKKSKRGVFSKKAKQAGMSVQQYAHHVLSHKDEYQLTTERQAQFVLNAKKFNHKAADGISLPELNYNYPTLDVGAPTPINNPYQSYNIGNVAQPIVNQQDYLNQPVNFNGALTPQMQQLAIQNNQPQPYDPTGLQIVQGVANAAQVAGGIAGNGGNKLGNAISAGSGIASSIASVIPGGQLAAPVIGAVGSALGGIVNLFGHHKPKVELPDVKIIRPTQSYNQNPQGTGSSILANGGEMPNGGTLQTKLTPAQEKKYQSWRSKLPEPLQYEGNYDLRGLYKSNPNAQPSANMHFPDTYKLPNHPTFSNESIYFNPQTNLDSAGHWQQTDSSFNYIPYNPQYRDTVVEKLANGGNMSLNEGDEIELSAEELKQLKDLGYEFDLG